MVFRRYVLGCIAFLATAYLSAASASAETIFVQSPYGQKGHGWLFGASDARAGECWIAVPAHVIESPETHELSSFQFTDRNGRSGESEQPIRAPKPPPSEKVNDEAEDLAFAKVKFGRGPGACQSRLGLPTLLYRNLLETNTRLTVLSILPTSYGAFELNLSRGSLDQYGGAIIFLEPASERSVPYLQEGISGATITAERDGAPVPVAMILKVNDQIPKIAHALRYDYISERFKETAAEASKATAAPSARNGRSYTILAQTGVPLAGNTGASALQDGTGCWRAAAAAGQNQVELTVQVDASSVPLQTLELKQAPDCGMGDRRFWVDERSRDGQDWNFVASCNSPPAQSQACRVSLSGSHQLRIRIEAKSPVGASALLLH